jgi:hypothetical protein
MTPLVWNTLDETATYLSEATGKSWTKNEVLSAAIEYPISIHRNLTFIQVAMPKETRFGVCIHDFDMPAVNPFRRIRQHVWIPIRLRQHHVSDLLIHGEIQISDAGNSESVDMLSEEEYVFIEPLGSKHIVNLDMLRIKRNDLKELAHKIKTGARSMLDPLRRETATSKESTIQKLDASLAENKQPLTEISDVSQVSYTTEEIEIQKKAVTKFWQNHDPARTPKKDEIVAWLMEEGISNRTAISMDSVMRPPITRKGGNKRVTPLKANK